MFKNQQMEKNSITRVMKQVFDFIAMIILLNVMTSRMELVSNNILNCIFVDEEKNQIEVFHSMDAIILIQKSVVMALSSWVLFSAQQLFKQKVCEKNSGNMNKNTEKLPFLLTKKLEVFLGSITFLANNVFMDLQLSTEVIFIVVSKCINALFIICLVHHFIQKDELQNKKPPKKNFKKAYLKKNIALFIIVVIAKSVIKLTIEELFQFYRGSGGLSFASIFKFKSFLIWGITLVLDSALYGGLYWIKRKYSKNISIVQQQQEIENNVHVQDQISPITLLKSWTKYTVMIYFVSTLMNGELFYAISFIRRHPSILSQFFQLSLFYFICQWATCRIFLKYRPHLFFSIIMTNGMFGKAYFYLFKSLGICSVPYYLVVVALIIMLKQQISDKKQTRQYLQINRDQKQQINTFILSNPQEITDQCSKLKGSQKENLIDY